MPMETENITHEVINVFGWSICCFSTSKRPKLRLCLQLLQLSLFRGVFQNAGWVKSLRGGETLGLTGSQTCWCVSSSIQSASQHVSKHIHFLILAGFQFVTQDQF